MRLEKKSMGKVPLLFQGQTTYKEDLSLKAIFSSFQVRKNLSNFESNEKSAFINLIDFYALTQQKR